MTKVVGDRLWHNVLVPVLFGRWLPIWVLSAACAAPGASGRPATQPEKVEQAGLKGLGPAFLHIKYTTDVKDQTIRLFSIDVLIDGQPWPKLVAPLSEGPHTIDLTFALKQDNDVRVVQVARSLALRVPPEAAGAESKPPIVTIHVSSPTFTGDWPPRFVFDVSVAVPPPEKDPQAAAAPRPPDWVPPVVGEKRVLSRERPKLHGSLMADGDGLANGIKICVATDGAVANVNLLYPSHALFDGATMDALLRWRFSPMTVNDVPVPFCYLQRNILRIN